MVLDIDWTRDRRNESQAGSSGGYAVRRPIERVLQVHTRYRHPGGEDHVVAAEKRLLDAAGIDVRQILFDNAELVESRSLLDDVRLAAAAVWSRDANRRVAAELKAHRPDVV